MIAIRIATVSDSETIASWIFEEKGLLDHLPVETEKEILDFVRNLVDLGEKKNALVVEDQGKVVAIANLFTTEYIKLKHHAQMTMIVEKNNRNKGIGSDLIDALFKHAKELGIEQLDLELYDNPWHAFFEKKGFKSYVTQPRYLKTKEGYFARTIYRKNL